MRSTSIGKEAIILGSKRADGEQYLTVPEHRGVQTLKWNLNVGSLQPTLRSDGSVLISPRHVVSGFRILPLAIFDTHGKNITPHGLHWGLEKRSRVVVADPRPQRLEAPRAVCDRPGDGGIPQRPPVRTTAPARRPS